MKTQQKEQNQFVAISEREILYVEKGENCKNGKHLKR